MGGGVPTGGAPHAQPAVAVLGRTTHRDVAGAADHDRHPGLGRRQDPATVEPEELPVVVDRLAGGEPPQQAERLVHPTPTGRRVDPHVRHLGAVLAGDTDAEGQPARRDLAERRELAGGAHRVAQAGEVDADQHVEAVVRGEGGGGRDEAVEAGAAVEADVVTDGEVVEPDVAQVREQGATLAGVGVEELVVDRDADLDVQGVHARHGRGRPRAGQVVARPNLAMSPVPPGAALALRPANLQRGGVTTRGITVLAGGLAETVAITRAADAAGFDGAWSGEFLNRSAVGRSRPWPRRPSGSASALPSPTPWAAPRSCSPTTRASSTR